MTTNMVVKKVEDFSIRNNVFLPQITSVVFNNIRGN